MGKVKTKVINKTGGEIYLQEGNVSVYKVVAKLCNDESHVISLDPNATYRDYVFMIMPDMTQLDSSISSDDCMEYSEIKIMRSANNSYFLERVPRASRRTSALANPAPAPGIKTSAVGNGASKNFYQKIKNAFSSYF
ncbi:hypothetical protein KC19_5G166300 [Ceratodon purpureus]|uniref:DUF7748 domain-containing protein n=1 Tax=Ceratodon purpureus TaxID=3225 RepID=A0A8T0I572_CERPU|nr:hypothetical protein KC19_5G166300 [Ceratodon purpureus]